MKKTNPLISHGADKELSVIVTEIRQKLIQEGDKPYITVSEQLQLLDELQKFELGRFLILNQGLNGYWTNYILMYPEQGKISGLSSDGNLLIPLEKRFLNEFPGVRATQQRFVIFKDQIQKVLKSNVKLASIPCGLMAELLTVNYSDIQNFSLIGVDLDNESLQLAKGLASELDLLRHTQFFKQDAWSIEFDQKFNLISSNGLNIYEHSDDKVTELYHHFYKALIPGGHLIASFLTPPPNLDKNSEWLVNKIDHKNLLLQKIIFSDILQVKWQCFRTSDLTKLQLQQAGFQTINFIYDEARIFPTVVARKEY